VVLTVCWLVDFWVVFSVCVGACWFVCGLVALFARGGPLVFFGCLTVYWACRVLPLLGVNGVLFRGRWCSVHPLVFGVMGLEVPSWRMVGEFVVCRRLHFWLFGRVWVWGDFCLLGTDRRGGASRVLMVVPAFRLCFFHGFGVARARGRILVVCACGLGGSLE